jgi:hypothetical protein
MGDMFAEAIIATCAAVAVVALITGVLLTLFLQWVF